jgi:hypothetical protein
MYFLFSLSHTDTAIHVVMYTFDGNPIHMQKITTAIQKPSKNELPKLTGKYYSAHLDFYWTLMFNENNELVVKRPTIADKTLDPWRIDGEYRLLADYDD